MTATREPDVGGRMEELLREYFIGAGYFAVRGIKLRYADADVTDIDLWLYSRLSSIARERVNVDAKYKQTPKALERVLWAKGAQAIIGAERCIVATTDKRPLVKEFGKEHGVLVLDGHFLGRLAHSTVVGNAAPRLSDEEFESRLNPKTDRRFGEWRNRVWDAKARLVFRLDFDGCNLWLDDVSEFLRAAAAQDGPPITFRLAYLCMSFFLVGLDHATRHLAFEEASARKAGIENGLRYGRAGRERMAKNLRLATSLIERYSPESRSLGFTLERRAMADVEHLPVDSIAEFASKNDVSSELFALAREFEAAAYGREGMAPSAFSAKGQACLGAALDFADIDRNGFYARGAALLRG